MALATGSALADIELPSGMRMYISALDISNCFYHFELPASLRPYFALKGVRASALGLDTIEGQSIPPGQVIYPRFCAVPMGWGHAARWCQEGA